MILRRQKKRAFNFFYRLGLRLVEVDAAITLENEVFSKELENKSSIRYKAMETKVKKEVRKYLPGSDSLTES